jgi:hypothetical protein
MTTTTHSLSVLTVRTDDIQRAIERARAITDDWQAECLEILLIPALAKRWQELNPNMPNVVIRRHVGEPYKGMTPDDNRQVEDWSRFAGYVFSYGFHDAPNYGWNAVGHGARKGYSHSAGSAWNGVGRETIHRWVEALRIIVSGYDHPQEREVLERAGIVLE